MADRTLKASPDNDAAAVGDSALSRRAFFRLNAAMLAAAGTASCTWRRQPLDNRDALQLLRAEDLLSLRVEFTNLAIEHRYLKPSRLVRAGAATASVTFIVPGQHIAEQAFPPAQNNPSLPAATFIAEPTRLVFEWPAELQHIDLTVAQLLSWNQWRFNAGKSSLHIPAGITLTPNAPIAFTHATKPVIFNGRSELWHTRLEPADPTSQQLSVTIALADTPDSFATTPTSKQRRAIDSKDANLHTLMLSPMGGWLDVRGTWREGDVRRWEHRATAGQDQRVLIENAEGFLYPFGHRASVVEVTERVLDEAQSRDGAPIQAAMLRRRRFIVIKQPSMNYAAGSTALRRVDIQQKVTPPLSGDGADIDDADSDPFWVESGDQPFAFRAVCEDWAGHSVAMSFNAVFVANDDAQFAPASALFEQPEYANRRHSELAGQSTVVAPFQTTSSLDASRSEGDTTLQLLALEHGATLASDQEAPFLWITRKMHARVPALANELPPEINQGWFDYLNPEPASDSNVGEVFAIASEGARRIPMHYSDKADRSGGLVTPSINVDGMSRLLGPVGDAQSVRDGSDTTAESYFSDDAKILTNFSLTGFDVTFPAKLAPKFYFKVSPKPKLEDKPDEKPADQDSDIDDPSDADRAEVQNKKAGKSNGKTLRIETTAKTGLQWDFDLSTLDYKVGPIRLVSQLDAERKPVCRATLNAELSKTLSTRKYDVPGTGDSNETTDSDEATQTKQADPPTPEDDTKPAQKPPFVNWQVTAEVTTFDLRLEAGKLGALILGFGSIKARIGTPKPKDDQKKDSKPVAKEEAADSDQKEEPEKKKKYETSVDCTINRIAGEGGLLLFGSFLDLVRELQEKGYIPLNYDNGGQPVPYPSSVPAVSETDTHYSIGPVKMPNIQFTIFSISDITVSLGVGLYLFPREDLSSGEMVVPGSLVTFAIGSAEKPLTVLAPPWGGVAHMAAAIDFKKGLVGFQFSMGVAAGTKFEFGIGKGICLGTLAVTYTYLNTTSQPHYNELALMLRLEGKASIAGWIELSLRLTAIGAVNPGGWTFAASLEAHIKIAFFVVSVALRFEHFIAHNNDRMLASDDKQRITRTAEQWQQYQAAFAAGAQ